LTDGIAQEVDETKRKLEVYGSVPLSVIFVGIGRSGFNVMYDLTNQAGCHRKNSTFVEFRLHQHDPTSLGLAALKDVPNQLVEYMSQENIEPNI
jgi:predicted ThiF/HesA family dinucleotide-utilizing enzyme